MRSRPDLTVLLEPRWIIPGMSFRAVLVLKSRSETPVDAIELNFVGEERRLDAADGAPAERRTLHAAGAVLPAMTLTEGEYRPAASFDLPSGLPASYRSACTAIEYALDVRVRIPWWPDRHERFLVPVLHPPGESPRGSPRTVASSDEGARGTRLYMEASLDSTEHARGDTVHGAVSFSNVVHHHIQRIEVSFVTIETSSMAMMANVAEAGRHTVCLVEGPPEDGKPIPFHLRLPLDVPCSFATPTLNVSWKIEFRAVIAFGADIFWSVSITLLEPRLGGGERAPVSAPRVAPIGKERRALVWAEVASRTQLVNDADSEQMTGAIGPVSFAITLEDRGDAGHCHVATLRWPRLGIGLMVTERRWVDALDGDAFTLDGPSGPRLAVRAADSKQSMAMFGGDVRRALVAFEQVAADDEGAVVASAGSAHTVAELSSFVETALAAATALAAGIARIPPPAAMARFVPEWRAFAARYGGRFEVGRVYVHDAIIDRERVSIGTRRARSGLLEATVVRVQLPTPLPEEISGASTVSPEVRARIDALTTESDLVRVGPEVIEARLPAPLRDPETVVPFVLSITALARALRGEPAYEAGPYR